MQVRDIVLDRRPAPTAEAADPLGLSVFDVREESERAYLERILSHHVQYPAGQELVQAGARLDAPLVLRSGLVGRVVVLSDGRRQIMDLYVPGELIGYSSRPELRAHAAYTALTAVEVSPAAALWRCSERPQQFPNLVAGLRRWEEAVERRLLAQIVRLGRQSAREKVASFLVELQDRFQALGQLQGGAFPFHLTQEIIADTLGLSIVHVNRTLQQLKRQRLIASRGNLLELRAVDKLRELAGLSPEIA